MWPFTCTLGRRRRRRRCCCFPSVSRSVSILAARRSCFVSPLLLGRRDVTGRASFVFLFRFSGVSERILLPPPSGGGGGGGHFRRLPPAVPASHSSATAAIVLIVVIVVVVVWCLRLSSSLIVIDSRTVGQFPSGCLFDKKQPKKITKNKRTKSSRRTTTTTTTSRKFVFRVNKRATRQLMKFFAPIRAVNRFGLFAVAFHLLDLLKQRENVGKKRKNCASVMATRQASR